MSHNPLKIKPSIPLQMGWIPYWNLRPLGQEIRRMARDEINFHSGAPALVNKMLTEKKVRLAPCSSVCLLKNSTHQMAFPLGVASTGAVKSVYIGFSHSQLGLYEAIRNRHKLITEVVQRAMKVAGSDIRKSAELVWKGCAALPPMTVETPEIIMTPASAASATLTRILYRLWFGEAPVEIRPRADHLESNHNEGDQPIELLIGDEALVRRSSFAKIIDLGDAWTALTGLPFVFAVWQGNGQTLSPYWGNIIVEAAARAQKKMHVDPVGYLPEGSCNDVSGHPIDLGAYWKRIHYRLGPQHFHGLTLFLSLARQLNPEAMREAGIKQIVRCQELALPSF